MFKRLAHWLSDRNNAVLAALVLAVVPGFYWMALVVVALYAIYRPLSEAIIVALWVSLPPVVWGCLHFPLIFFQDVVCGVLPVLLLAWAHGRSMSWRMTSSHAMLLACLSFSVAYLVVPDLHDYWKLHLMTVLHDVAQWIPPELEQNIAEYTSFWAMKITGVYVTAVFLTALFSAYVAELLGYAEALHEQPSIRFYAMHLTWTQMVLLVTVFVASCFSGAVGDWANDCLSIVLCFASLSGILRVHQRFTLMTLSFAWFVRLPLGILLYGLLFIQLPYSLFLLSVVALMDALVYHAQALRHLKANRPEVANN